MKDIFTPARISLIRRRAWQLFLLIFIGIPFYFKAVEYNFLYLFGKLPSTEKLENPKMPTASELYTADGVLLGRYYHENRTPVVYDSISSKLILALIATEDVRFYEHSGIDLIATGSILWYLIRNERRGGSTISQQLAKNLFKTRESSQGYLSNVPFLKTLIIKTKEWITAINLEKSYSKEEIITMYFNTVDFGSNAYGIKTAAKTFFRKSPKNLNWQEAATLVGLLKAPTFYSPIMNPKNAVKRRNRVFEQMYKYGFIQKTEYETLLKTKLETNYFAERPEDGAGTYFRGVMNNYLTEWCQKNGYDLHADGLKIYTTIDSRAQKLAEEAVSEHIQFLQKEFYRHWRGADPWTDRRNNPLTDYLDKAIKTLPIYKILEKQHKKDSLAIAQQLYKKKKMTVFSWQGERDTLFSSVDSLRYYKHFLHAGMMAMDPSSGFIRAWVGGINYKYFKYDHVKQSKRQPGSTFKPFVYSAAIDGAGFSPCDRIVDYVKPIYYVENGEKKVWIPHNADWSSSGRSTTLRHAIGRSLNTITAQLTEKIGWELVAEYAKKMGITSELNVVPSIGLGSSNVSLYEMVGAYGTFVNEGVWTEPTFITRIEHKGKVIFTSNPKRRRAISQESAFLMIHMLKGGIQEPGGTSGRLYRYNIFGGNEIGGKTGTSSGHADGWYIGITKDLVAGAWVGGDDLAIHFRSSDYGEGSKMALPIFGLFLEKVYQHEEELGITKGAFPRPQIRITKPYWCPTPRIERDTTKKEVTVEEGTTVEETDTQ